MFEKTLTFLGLAVLATTAITAQAAPAPFDARDIHGERVGPNTLLWAHVFRAARPGQPPTARSIPTATPPFFPDSPTRTSRGSRSGLRLPATSAPIG